VERFRVTHATCPIHMPQSTCHIPHDTCQNSHAECHIRHPTCHVRRPHRTSHTTRSRHSASPMVVAQHSHTCIPKRVIFPRTHRHATKFRANWNNQAGSVVG
jgi:hypothetical protein